MLAHPTLALALILTAADRDATPAVPTGWKAELIARAPEIAYPTAIVAAPDGTIYLGQDPMDMPGPPTTPSDSVIAIRPDGKKTVFADKLWAVMGLEWIEGTLYVVHAPFLSALRDTNGDGKADQRTDLMTGLGPKVPGFNGINDHIASGVRLGMDGFLYIAVGDKGIPRGVGKDGASIRLRGGGVIRIRPDGTGLEIVSTGERNPLSVALTASDEIFTYGNDDDSKKWPNSLTHHIVGGHYGYPYDFLLHPERCLPIVGGRIGGSGTQAICYLEDGLPESYRGDLFVCDWGLQAVFRIKVEKTGGTFRVKEQTPFVTRGDLGDFRPFSIAAAPDGTALYLVDWAFNGWLADGPKAGRLFRLTYRGPDVVTPARRSWDRRGTILEGDASDKDVQIITNAQRPPDHRRRSDFLLARLDHPSRSERLGAQRALARMGPSALSPLAGKLGQPGPTLGRVHALWALDATNTPEARAAIRKALNDPGADVRLQAARSAGIRGDRQAVPKLIETLHDDDPGVRRESAIALGKIGDHSAAPGLLAALGDRDPVADWSIRHALRSLKAWEREALTQALLDPKRRDSALKLTDEAYSVAVVDALIGALGKTKDGATRSRIVANLAGLYRREPEWSGQWFGTNPLAGKLPEKSKDWSPEGMARVAAGLIQGLGDADPAVRRIAIAGLRPVGPAVAPALRERLGVETDQGCLKELAAILGALADPESAPTLARLVQDPTRAIATRTAALDALGRLAGPIPLRARFALIFDPKAPPELIARALPGLAEARVLPANDLAGFLNHKAAPVRAAAIAALAARPPVSESVRAALIGRLGDQEPEVRRAAIIAVASLKLNGAIPRLIELARPGPSRLDATRALAGLPDPRALPVYLAALDDRDPEVRRAGEAALLAIRDAVADDLKSRARASDLSRTAAEAIERVVTPFAPIVGWKVIGPFPRTTAQIFIGERSIDFSRKHAGVEGRMISWKPRRGDPKTGRVNLDDFKGGAGDRGGFGYDASGSPDLCAFGYADLTSDRERPALLLIGSSGTLTITLNEQVVFDYGNFAGRAYAPDSDRVRVTLRKGVNRLLVRSRQGIGQWSFGVQVSEPSARLIAARDRNGLEELRSYALGHDGDPARGASIFFDPNGVGCVKCHAAGGRGTATIGPDLTALASQYDRAEIIRSVLEPSDRIANGYQPVVIAKRDGIVINGLLRAETDAAIELVDIDTKVVTVARTEIEERRIGTTSVMPTNLVEGLGPEEFADLIAYLLSLKGTPAGGAGPGG